MNTAFFKKIAHAKSFQYFIIGTIILGLIIHKTIGFTVDPATQDEGLDYKEHGETAYRLV